MNREQRERFEQMLLRERDRLGESIQAIENRGLNEPETVAIGDLSSYDQHPADHGTETYERSKDLGLKENQEVLLGNVYDALDRIKQGTYGTCERCGNEIPIERLEALPYTTLCIDCRREREIVDRQVRPVEEDVLESPWSRSFSGDRKERVGFDGEDAWQELASWGTANSPQDVPDSRGYDDAYVNADDDVGIVGEVDDLPDLSGQGVTDLGAIYPDPQSNPRRRPHSQDWKGTDPDELPRQSY